MAWLLLIGAGILEIGWPLGFKLASIYEKYFYLFITVSIISMGTRDQRKNLRGKFKN